MWIVVHIRCVPNVDHQLMSITLSKPNRFWKFLTVGKRSKCKQNPCNIAHHTQSMLPHSLWKIKVQLCDKLQMSRLMKRNISRQTVRQTMLLSSLQRLSAFCPHTRSKTRTPLVNCIINDALVHDIVPNVQQTLLQFINAVQLRLMHSLLDVTPCLAIDRIVVGAILWPQIWRNENGCWLLEK